MKITTNNHWREFLYGVDLPEEEKEHFDFLEDDLNSSQFIKYKGSYYYLGDFLKVDHIKGWHGAIYFTYVSGILIAVEGGMYKIGYFY